MNFTIENWQQIIPRDKWRDFAIEEAHHSADAVNRWLDNPTSPTLLAEAMDTRSAFVREYIERENIDTSVRNMVPYGIEQDAIFRIKLIEELANSASQTLRELNDSK
jgi:hypothetical protein